MAPLRWLSFALLVGAVVAGASWALQRQSTAALREEIALLRDENRLLARLRAENRRLRSEQVPTEELQRLQADRAAIQRLRMEIEGLKTRAEERARDATMAPPAPSPASPPPALALKIGVDSGGTLSLDGNVVDLAQLRERFAGLGKGERVDIHLAPAQGENRAQMADISRSMKNMLGLAKELGLKMSINLKPADQAIAAEASR